MDITTALTLDTLAAMNRVSDLTSYPARDRRTRAFREEEARRIAVFEPILRAWAKHVGITNLQDAQSVLIDMGYHQARVAAGWTTSEDAMYDIRMRFPRYPKVHGLDIY